MATLDLQVTAISDDGGEDWGGSVGLVGDNMSLIGIMPVWIGTRFLNVTIPPGATISVAYWQPYIQGSSDDPNLVLTGDLALNSPTFTTASNNISGRTDTTASVNWIATGVGSGFQNSPAITAIIQEIIDQAGWESGNALSILASGIANSDFWMSGYGTEMHPEEAAKLHIEYTPETVGEVAVKVPHFAHAAALFEVDWPGTGITWTDESLRVIIPITYSYGIVSPGGTLSQLGEGPVAQMTVRVANADGRFSVDRTGSQAQVNGIYQKPARFSPGYYDSGGTPQRATVFTGRIQDVQEDEASATVALTISGLDFDIQQQRPETLAHSDHRTDELIADVATEIAFTGTSLDRGYTVVPWHFADADPALAEMREIAEAEAGIVWVNPMTGELEFWSWAKWIGAASEATYTRSLLENVRPRHDPKQALDIVNVTYQPRRAGRLMNLHQLGSPIVIAPLGTYTTTIRFRYPIAEYDSYEVVASTSGGVKFTEGVELTVSNADDSTPWVPETAMSSRVKFANASANHGMVIRKFDVVGRPIEGLPNREYKADRNYLVVHRRTDVKPNELKMRYCGQHEAQAALVAELKAYRLQDPPVLLTIGPMPGNPELNVGSAITVNIAAGISQINKLVVLLHRQGTYDLRFEETWLAVPQDELYQYATLSTGTGDGAFKVGTSRLSYGRIQY